MALLLQELGYGLGQSLSYGEERRAGMELSTAYSINVDMYKDYIEKGLEVDLDKPSQNIDQYWERKVSLRERMTMLDEDTPASRNEGKIEVIKDPRITWSPLIIRTWWWVRKDLKLIILHRDPAEIIRSREKVGLLKGGINLFQDPKRKKNVDEFFKDFSDFYSEVNELGIPHALFVYPFFFDYPAELILSRLNKAGIAEHITLERFKDAWDKVFDRSKISFLNEVN